MELKKVKIIADEGTKFGILYMEKGEIAITVCPPGKDWPHGLKPIDATVNTIAEGCKAYIVQDE